MENQQTGRVYACAGCADVGEIADQVARKLRTSGFFTPSASCLAGIGAGIQSFIEAAQTADVVATIDGCEVCCAKKTLENISLSPTSFVLTNMGCVKGSTHSTEQLITSLADTIIGSTNNHASSLK